jgi:Ca2+-binding RTX toxin-like protein
MPTSIQLSESQRHELAALRDQAEARGNAVGAWADFYGYLARTIANTVLNLGEAPVQNAHILQLRGLLPGDEFQTLVWLVGGMNVNSANGAFSQMIRDYNVRQGLLRGFTFTDAQLQLASNEVARRMAVQILGDGSEPGNGGYIPTVREIGEHDLRGVRDVLYPGNENSGDPMYLNQAWPGIVMLGAQGQDFLGRLLQPNAADTPVALDTLGDIQNLLFAWDSFSYAWQRLSLLGGSYAVEDVGILLGIGTPALAINGFASMSFDQQGRAVFHELIRGQNPEAASALQQIAAMGSNSYLDMLIGTRQGRIQLGTTTDASFAQRARDFFSSFSAAERQSLSASLLPLSPGALASLAREDVNARAALAALSVVSVQIDEGAAGRLSLYDPATGEGALSDQWLVDRAMLLTAISARGQLQGVADHPALPTDRAYEFHYIDGTGTEQILIAENTARLGGNTRPVPRQQVYFGGSDNDSFTADPNNGRGVRMFGGDGDDTLNGADKDDYLEGNNGNDVLRGGSGNDALVGGSGNDTLDGGTGNDWLYGGAGHDTYVFSGSFGADVIEDSDGDGVIQVEGIGSLPVGMELAEGVYASEDRRVFYTRVSARAGEEDLIVSFSDRPDTITIRNWSAERHLGITLQQPQAPTPPATTFEGDFVKEVIGDGTLRYRIVDGNFVRTGQSLPGGQDVYTGTSASERILGMGGDDALFGNGGEDWIDGGDGNDVLFGGSGRDRILGGAGDDVASDRPDQFNNRTHELHHIPCARPSRCTARRPDHLRCANDPTFALRTHA